MLENRLICLNTKFQKREGKLWTYTNANNTKVQIDYGFINKKWNNSALNCEAYSSFKGVSSKLSWQKYNWACEGIQPEEQPLYIMTRFFSLGVATGLGEGKTLNSKAVKLRLKIDLVSYPARAEGLGKYDDWSLLNNRDIRDKYALALRSKFDALQERDRNTYSEWRIWEFRQCLLKSSSRMHTNQTKS